MELYVFVIIYFLNDEGNKKFPSLKGLKCLVNLERGREINIQFYEDKKPYVTRK